MDGESNLMIRSEVSCHFIVHEGFSKLSGHQEERQTLLEGDDHVEARTADTAEPGQSKRKNLGILEVLIHPDYSKAVIAVIMVMLSQQFTGIV